MAGSSILWLLLAAATLLAPGLAGAHSLSRSHSRWVLSGSQARVKLTVPLVEVARLRRSAARLPAAQVMQDLALRRWLKGYATSRLRLADRGAGCQVQGPVSLSRSGHRRLVLAWRLGCNNAPRPGVRADLFFDAAPSHLHFVSLAAKGRNHEAVLTRDQREASFGGNRSAARPARSGLLDFIWLGCCHVLAGADHVAFVVGLLLLGGGLLTSIKVATGFTLGHSMTLALAAMGLVRPLETSVEVLVGLSIFYVGLEYFHHEGSRLGRRAAVLVNFAVHGLLLALALAGRALLPWPIPLASALVTGCHLALQQRHGPTAMVRFWVALMFGLVHGLAFAGALREALQGASLMRALAGFNIGVEAGQAVIILAVVPLFGLARRRLGPRVHLLGTSVTAAAVVALGLGWTFGRALGG